MTDAIKTARGFVNLMEAAAYGAGFAPGAIDCGSRATGARWVIAYLNGSDMYGSPATLDDAQKGARRAWRDDIPADVAAALGMGDAA